jgi:antitoxin (DNA-binding transcriptional repressor) of toxin-antitoxin stability system
VATSSYNLDVRAVGIRDLKNQLSRYVRLAAAGETVLVTDRDRVVAELIPPRQGRGPTLSDALLADAVREGWLTPPLDAGAALPDRSPVAPLAEILEEHAEDREDR